MPLASNIENIRYNGTGRAYAGAVGGASFDDLGELDGLQFGSTVTTSKIKTTRNASRATILEVEDERDSKVSFGLREMSENNLKMALLGGDINTDNQSASYVYQGVTTALVADLFVDLGKLNVFSTKLTGTITGALAVGDSVTGAVSGATGKIAYKADGYIELVNVSGTFQAGEQVYETEDTNHIVPTGVETLRDVIVTDDTGAERRVQGEDYDLDPDYGYIRQLTGGDIAEGDLISYDHEAVDRKYMHAGAAASVTRKLIFVSDPDDQGVRMRWTFHKVKIALNGDFPLIGDGEATMKVEGAVLKDTSQAAGQEFYKVEVM